MARVLHQPATAPATYALTIGSQADALGLTGTQFAAPTATKNGVSITITAHAWTVTGPVTLDDDEIAQPTPTHTGAGYCTRQLAATLADGAVVYSAMDSWTVGDADRRYRTHFVDWEDAANAGALMSTTPTKDGIAIAFGYSGGSGGSTWTASDGVGLVGTFGGGATGLAMDWSGADLGSETLDAQDDVVWYFAFSTLTPPGAPGDVATLNFLNAAGTYRVVARLYYSSPNWSMKAEQVRGGVTTNLAKVLGTSPPGMFALRLEAGVVAEARYSMDAYDPEVGFPAFSTMTKVYTTRASNMFACMDLVATDTADNPVIAGSIGRMSFQTSPVTIGAQEIRRRPV